MPKVMRPTYTVGDTHKEFIIETTSSGAIIFDYDNDGWPDIFLPNGSAVEGFAKDRAPTGHLYHNNRDGTFTDVTAQAGLKASRDEWSTGCSFVDYDRDGKVDILVVRYVDFRDDSVPRPGQGCWCQWKGINKRPSLYYNTSAMMCGCISAWASPRERRRS
jgi:hypothetical protein